MKRVKIYRMEWVQYFFWNSKQNKTFLHLGVGWGNCDSRFVILSTVRKTEGILVTTIFQVRCLLHIDFWNQAPISVREQLKSIISSISEVDNFIDFWGQRLDYSPKSKFFSIYRIKYLNLFWMSITWIDYLIQLFKSI